MNKALLLALTLCLAGCGPAAVRDEPPLAGARLGGPFTLTDQDGRMRTDTMFAGQYRLMYFGYTFCPDVCPVDLQKLMQGYAKLEKDAPAKAAKLAPIFVTVDPARDTVPVLKQFVSAFHPRLIGLTGPESEIAQVAKRYAIYYKINPPAPGSDGYLVDHARQATLFDGQGKPVALIPQDGTPDEIAAELEKWIR